MRDIVGVFFCGAHSTGKTTLLKDVGSVVDIHQELDLARTVVKEMGVDLFF